MRKEVLVNRPANIYLQVISEEQTRTIKDIAVDFKSNKERADSSFKELFGVTIKNVIAFGRTDKVSSQMLNKIIPDVDRDRQVDRSHEIPRIELSASTIKNKKYGSQYKCYAVPTPSVIMHEDIRSSWNCLMSVVNHPEYVLIYTKSTD